MVEKPINKREKLVVIDGNHLIHRAFHAIQAPLKTSRGEPTNALYGFASILLNMIDLEKPDYLLVTFDEKGPTFRHEIHKEYKATRVKAPDALYVQIPRIHQMLERLKMPLFSCNGYEADDLMGTIAKQAAAEGLEVFLVTGDHDILQLIGPHVKVVFPHKGYRAPVIFDEKKVLQEYGITPSQVADYKALAGDSSDNIKGVQGIGPKRASELLKKYSTLQAIYAHLDEIPSLISIKLKNGKKDAYFAKSLTQIVTDVPCHFDREKARFNSLNFKALEEFFAEMEIHSLQQRLKKILPRVVTVSKDQMSLF